MNLFRLPDELLALIVDNVQSERALLNLALTCSKLHALSISSLYRLNERRSLDAVEALKDRRAATEEARARRTAFDADEDEESESDESYVSDDDGQQRSAEDDVFLQGNAISWAIDENNTATIKQAAAVIEVYRVAFLRQAVEEGTPEIIEALLCKSRDETIRFLAPIASDLVHRACNHDAMLNFRKLRQLGLVFPPDVSMSLVTVIRSGLDDSVEFIQEVLDVGADAKGNASDGPLPILEAADVGNIEIMRLLLDHGAGIHDIQSGTTVLTRAIASNSIEIVKLALGLGADINAVPVDHMSHVQRAAWNNSIDMVKLLIESNIGSVGPGCLEAALPHQNIELLEYLIDHGADIRERHRHGTTALCHAANLEHTTVVEFLLRKGADVNETSDCGCTALGHACERPDLETMQVLVEAGADLSFVDEENRTLIHRVATGGSVDCAKYILQQADKAGVTIDLSLRQSPTHDTALEEAISRQHLAMVEYLVNLPAMDVNTLHPSTQRTPLFSAARAGLLDAVRCLVDAGAKLNVVDGWGATPIYAAARNGRENVVSYLLELDPTLVNVKDRFGMRPVDWTMLCGPSKLIQMLNSYNGEPVVTEMPPWYPGPLWNDFRAFRSFCDVCTRMLVRDQEYWQCGLQRCGLMVCRHCWDLNEQTHLPTCLHQDMIAEGNWETAA